MHYQSVWHERTANRNLPAWLRVAFLAFGAHKANGHAQFKRGEIAEMLGHVDEESGEFRPAHKSNVQRAIRAAVEAGYLAPGSSSMCLVVPAHAIEGGMGNPHAPCPLHARREARERQARPSQLRAVR